jgi:tetratricopeptide (TPR) repeat protein
VLAAWSCVALAAALIASVRYPLSAAFHKVRAKTDVYALPSPEHAIVLSLGYRTALADLLFAHVLVSYGLHFEEKRRFEFVGNYLDTINALDPKFQRPYRFADTLLTIQPKAPRERDYRKAREILERGLRERPHDAELWSTAGQFLAYLAPPHLKDEKVKQEWRMAGARTLARACELVSKNENIPYHCITAAHLFSRAGERSAVIDFLQRILAVSDDEEIRRLALGYLEKTVSEQQRAEVEARYKRFAEAWRGDLPFVKKDLLLVIGPAFDPARCAGLGEGNGAACATTWRDWAALTAPRSEP